jgi:hydrogenase expression/formation protein HypC
MCLAIPGEVLRVEEQDGLPHADVRFAGIHRRVCIACTPEAKPGDYVLVHAGFSIALLDEDEARQTLSMMKELGAIP